MKRPPARAPSARWICVSGCAGIGATGFAGRRSDCGTLVVRRSIRLSLHSRLLLSALETKCLNVLHKSKHATLGRWYSTARVSKRPTYEAAACLRARYCTNLTCSDLNKCQKNLVNALLNASQSSAETEARTVVEKYFALYAAKDLDGLMGLWSAKLPDPAGKRKALGSQLETSDVIFSGLTISRVKIEGERASLRCVLDMTTTNKQNRRTATERRTSNFHLVREEGMWKLWEITPAVNDLAAALERAASEQEQEQILTQERYDLALENLRKSLRLREETSDRRGVCKSLSNLSKLYQNQGHYTEMLEVSRRAARLAEEIHDPQWFWTAQEDIGRALLALRRPEQARQNFLAAIGAIESMRREVAGGEQQRQSFLENRHGPWLGMIELLVSQKDYAER